VSAHPFEAALSLARDSSAGCWDTGCWDTGCWDTGCWDTGYPGSVRAPRARTGSRGSRPRTPRLGGRAKC